MHGIYCIIVRDMMGSLRFFIFLILLIFVVFANGSGCMGRSIFLLIPSSRLQVTPSTSTVVFYWSEDIPALLPPSHNPFSCILPFSG